jgi:predicted lysophospholipase L1 biosynthesis ABC-type transport system permease subunit
MISQRQSDPRTLADLSTWTVFRVLALHRIAEGTSGNAQEPKDSQAHLLGGGALVNAYLVEAEHGVVAVDSMLTVTDSRMLRQRLEALGKPLLAVAVVNSVVGGTTVALAVGVLGASMVVSVLTGGAALVASLAFHSLIQRRTLSRRARRRSQCSPRTALSRGSCDTLREDQRFGSLR